ncbi:MULTISPECIES: GPR endopeptidase [Bacillaceae]|uniref:GPR endopeptidase n=1 Tax=Bacillaceae TaxID=186817 RepID=UPI0006AF5C4C|nr:MULTISPECIES: GPR endopeptidase [Bacillaceae]ALC84914.1 spore gernimation protein [Bacillus sp. FJAT-22090]KQL34183.1 spore gernimation protein [Psychrobacillus sp. FJAT-21963]
MWGRTDLLDETEEMVQHKTKTQKETLSNSEGIKFDESRSGAVLITSIEVNEQGEKKIGKKKGKYITLTDLTVNPEVEESFEALEKMFLEKLDEMHQGLNLSNSSKVLIIGLGNSTITPDAIGPKAIEYLQGSSLSQKSENVKVVMYAPGVTGQTGFETSDFIEAISKAFQPDLIIVIDALAARNSERLCKTIQLTNTGIHPGSGVGNQRKEVSEEVYGVPVTAIGIPMVVDGPVLYADAMENVIHYIASKVEEKSRPSSALAVTPMVSSKKSTLDKTVLQPIFGEWVTWSTDEKRKLFEEVFVGKNSSLFVTPKETDAWVEQYAYLLSNGIENWISSR